MSDHPPPVVISSESSSGSRLILGCLVGCLAIAVLGGLIALGLGLYVYREVAPEIRQASEELAKVGFSTQDIGIHGGDTPQAQAIRGRLVADMDLSGWRLVQASNFLTIQGIALEPEGGGPRCTLGGIPLPGLGDAASEVERSFADGSLQVDLGSQGMPRSLESKTEVTADLGPWGRRTLLARTWIRPDQGRDRDQAVFLACPATSKAYFVACDVGATEAVSPLVELARRLPACPGASAAGSEPVSVPAPAAPLAPEAPLPPEPVTAPPAFRPGAPAAPKAPLPPRSP
ncbi:hypothetical protein L6R50_23585 [Myxococcota bacterium]|nr:hypothetical protein [Myxococcota bacterium]